ncbi:hypothetical protein ACHAWT_000175 [Skeletonema menzelii]
MASANDSSKRRRLLSSTCSDVSCLSDLPSVVLAHVAKYLGAPSRALFSAALSDKNAAVSTVSSERNSAIVGNDWSTLDFGDIEHSLSERLTDKHISSVLSCIDAVNELKTLKLTNCLNITGAGLEPLRGSTIIEQIDLSLVGKNCNPADLSPYPPISCDHVLPILDSIIEREGCSISRCLEGNPNEACADCVKENAHLLLGKFQEKDAEIKELKQQVDQMQCRINFLGEQLLDQSEKVEESGRGSVS